MKKQTWAHFYCPFNELKEFLTEGSAKRNAHALKGGMVCEIQCTTNLGNLATVTGTETVIVTVTDN